MKVEGVLSCDVSFEESLATVTVKKGIDPEAVAAGLSGRFKGSVKE